MQSVQRDFPQITRQQLERTRDLMNRYAVDSLVIGFDHQIEQFKLPDPHDRHVLAAAIMGKADVIVTFNLRDFPATALRSYGIEAQHPDAFITRLMEIDIASVIAATRSHRLNLKNPPKTVQEYLASLEGHGLPGTVVRLRAYLPLISE